MPPQRLGAERQLADHRAGFEDALEQLGVLGRIDHVDAARHHRHCAGRQRPLVRARVDAAGEARDDDEPLAAEVGGDLPGEAVAAGRRVARADDRDHVLAQELPVAAHGNQRRRIGKRRQRRRIIGLAERDQARPQRRAGLELTFGLGARVYAERPPPPAAAREVGKRAKRLLGRAEVAQELEERDRPDVLAAAQAQPGESLGVGQGEGSGRHDLSLRSLRPKDQRGARGARSESPQLELRTPRRYGGGGCWRCGATTLGCHSHTGEPMNRLAVAFNRHAGYAP